MENIFEMQDKIRVKYPNDIKYSEMVIMHHKTDFDTANAAESTVLWVMSAKASISSSAESA